MDWAIFLSMPLMLLMGFIGDALSRDDDEDDGMSQATLADADLSGASGGEDLAAPDGLSMMMMASEEGPEDAEPVVQPEVAGHDTAPEPEPEAEPEDAEDARAEAAVDHPPEGDTGEEAPPDADETAEADGEGDRQEVEGFDPGEDVLVVEAPGASEATPEIEQTEDGTLVRLAGQEAFLPGVSDLPTDEVVGVEPMEPVEEPGPSGTG